MADASAVKKCLECSETIEYAIVFCLVLENVSVKKLGHFSFPIFS